MTRFKVKRDLAKGRRKRLRAFWWGRGAKCIWCGRAVSYTAAHSQPHQATREHLIPRALGGPTGNLNVVVACYSCNHARGHDDTWVPYYDPGSWPESQRAHLARS